MAEYPVDLRFLSKQDVDSLITYEDVVQAVEQVFLADGLGELVVPRKEKMVLDKEGKKVLLPMPGYIKTMDTAGMKWMSFYPDKKEIPAIWGQLLILTDPDSGLPYAVMDATTITNMRTAGGHAVVAAKYLARRDSKVLSVIGCGAQGRSAIASFDRSFDLERIIVYDSFPDSLKRCKQELEDRLRAKLCFADSIYEAVSQADILVTATTSKTVLVKEEMVPEGCFCAAVYCFNDLDPKLSRGADKWVLGHGLSDQVQVLDNRNYGPLISGENVYTTLGKIVAGKKPGRTGDRECIVYTHMGMGPLDIAVGRTVYEKAVRQNVGQILHLI